MKGPPGQLAVIGYVTLVVLLVVGCSASPSPVASPVASPLRSVGESPITPGSACEDILSDASAFDVQGKLLTQMVSAGEPDRATLEVSDPNGANRRMLASVAPDRGSVAVSPDGQRIAFFSAAARCDALLVVWSLDGQMVFKRAVASEVSESFRDASAVRYLAWSPEGGKLAFVANRDLYVAEVTQQETRLLVSHREAKYTMAGNVMGSVGHPTWTVDGGVIVYDAFEPPEVLSASADQYRTVESVVVSDGSRETVVELGQDLRVTQWVTSPDGRSLFLRLEDGQSFTVDLVTLEAQAGARQVGFVDIASCDPAGQKCVSIGAKDKEGDVLYLLSGEGSELGSVRLADLRGSASKCQFQSALWCDVVAGPLATVGCGKEVELWSIATPGRKAERLTNWQNLETAILISSLR